MQVIAKYKYDQESYAIAIEDDYIIFLKWCDNEYKKCSEKQEQMLAFEVLSSLVPSQINSEFISNITINSHDYNLFYDETKKLYFWISKDKRQYPKDNIYLNKRYNHTPLCLYYNGKSKSPSDFIFRLFYKNKRAIALILTASISLSTLMGKDVLGMNTSSYSFQDVFVSQSITQTIDEKENLLQEALDCNHNLSQEEKDVISKLSFIFARYNGIINEQLVLERFKTLKIEYLGSSSSGEAGVYNRLDNTIFLYYPNFEGVLMSIFIHEVLHVFQEGIGIHFLEELSNEFFTREVILELLKQNSFAKGQLLNANNKANFKELSNDTELYYSVKDSFQGYDYYMDIYYILSRLLDAKDLAKFQFKGDIVIIEKALLAKMGNTEDNRRLVAAFSNSSYFLRPIEDNQFYFYFDKSICYKALNELFFRIKGHYLWEDLEACAFMSRYASYEALKDYSVFMNEDECSKKAIIPKTIFSDSMPYTIILYENNLSINKRVLNQDLQAEFNVFLNEKKGRVLSSSLQNN